MMQSNTHAVGFTGLLIGIASIFLPAVTAHTGITVDQYVGAASLVLAYFGMPFTVTTTKV